MRNLALDLRKMGALAALSGGGSTPVSVSPSSSASSGPSSSGATGNLVLNFGGINLGTQDIPISQTSTPTDGTNDPAVLGNTPLSAASVSAYMPLLIVAALLGIAWALRKHL
jgi:hypothetical protein